MKNILTGVADRLSSLREERPSAGTRYRLMGVAADVAEVTEQLSKEVLERVKQEPVLVADVDVDFDALAEEVLSWELVATKEELLENTQMVNDALGGLNDVLTQISSQLERRHKDEAYARLYDQEKRRYLSSGTPRRLRQTFDEWLYDVCNGAPSLDDINDYVTEKLVHMFKQAMYIADVFSDKLQMRSKWKPFQELWHINNLAQEKWEMQETGKSPARSEEIDKIFKD